MKIILIASIFSAFLLNISSVNAQCNGRYYDKQFSSSVSTVTYGQAGNTTLRMDIYQPSGDTAAHRPLIVLAFGGSFISGIRQSPDIVKLCQEFAQRGYVTASIDYRLHSGAVDSASMLRTVVRAVHDAKASLRYFYKDAATTNTYRIDTNYVFMGGTSAGAFIGVHLGYMQDTVSNTAFINDIINEVGGIEGNSGNPGFSSRIHGIINLAGAIGDTAWIDANEPPMVSMHGDQDKTVPFCSAMIRVSSTNIIHVDGSATMKRRTDNLGINNRFYTWQGADHVPYVSPFGNGPKYMDTTVWFIRDFLFDIVTGTECGQALATQGHVEFPCGEEIIDTTVNHQEIHSTLNLVSVYPNPSGEKMILKLGDVSDNSIQVDVYNYQGVLVAQHRNITSDLVLNKNDLGGGLFLLSVSSAQNPGERVVKRVIFH